MKVKKVIQEDIKSLPEIRDELIKIRDQRSNVSEEEQGSVRAMSYELRKSIDHADILAKCDVETAKSLYEDLCGLEKIRPEIAERIVNLMPKSRDELRAIYAKERFILVSEDLDAILDIIRKYE